MEKINVTTVSGVATSATAVAVVVPEFQKAKAVVKIPVAVANGHVFKGHTLASTDKLLLLTSGGWVLVSATYANAGAGLMYCNATITAVGVDIPANTRAYVVVPATDVITGLPTIGAAAVTCEDFICGDSGAPVLFEIVATSAKTTIAAALVEYWF